MESRERRFEAAQLIRRHCGRGIFAGIALLLMIMVLSPATSSAAVAHLWTSGSLGHEAGQTELPRGLVASKNLPGHLFVSDQSNQRISEFNPWGQFVKAWGWGVRDGSNELQSCTSETTCRQGILGSGAGQLNYPQGIAEDSEGNLYVVDLKNYRVQKFSPNGKFLLMFGGSVDKGPKHPGNVCTAAFLAEGDECGAGTVGPNPGEFGEWPIAGSFIAVDSANRIYVGDKERVQKFAASGAFVEELTSSAFSGKGFIQSLALDSLGNIYVAFGKDAAKSAPNVLKVNSTGESQCTMEVAEPRAIAVGGDSQVYVVSRNDHIFPESSIEEFNPNCSKKEVILPEGDLISPTGLATGSPCLSEGTDVYVTDAGGEAATRVSAYGPAPDNPACPPPEVPPAINDQFATKVKQEVATVKAVINPRFWKDTDYYVEYGTGKCSDEGCIQYASKPGVSLGAGIVDEEIPTAGVTLIGLLPSTEYHFRFLAESGGGGPVYGLDPDGLGPAQPSFSEGEEGTFTTPPASEGGEDSCPNARLRTGSNRILGDCRAYEMVSPVDKGSSDILALANVTSLRARLDQASTQGGKVTYSTYRAFGDAQAAPYMSQYLATRGTEGWISQSISPPQEGPMFTPTPGLDTNYKAFAEDLSDGWLVHFNEPVLAPGGVAGQDNLYRRDNIAGNYSGFSTSPTEGTIPSQYELELQGVSGDQKHAIFTANDNNPPAAKEAQTSQLYDSTNGVVQPVCILPNGIRTKLVCSAGTKTSKISGRVASVHNAISANGSRIFWTNGSGEGRLYVRIDNSETVAVSDAVNPKSPPVQARFWTAAADGSKAVFTANEGLYVFDVDTETITPIAKEVAGVAGASEDVKRIYFVSRESLGSGPGPQAGKPNLYLYEAGEAPSYIYIGTLTASNDSSSLGIPSPVALEPLWHVARVTPDGKFLAFMARTSLTGFDSKDQQSGQQDAQVFLFDAGNGALHCVSCNRTGARPIGRNLQVDERLLQPFWVSGRLPAQESQLYSSHLLANDGSRLFFESFDPLSTEDTNEERDVYEWEAPGVGSCETSRSSFNSAAGGCVSLISSGKSSQPSELIDASAQGTDVFFTTRSSLVPQDPDLIDIYDAREGGGFPVPQVPTECTGEACQPQASPPAAVLPASSTFTGPGNPSTGKRCPKGKKKATVKGKVRCVKNDRGAHRHHTHGKRGSR